MSLRPTERNDRLTRYLSFALTITVHVVYIHFTSCWSLIHIRARASKGKKGM